MRDGFIKVAAATPNIKVADVHYNAEQIIGQIKEAAEQGAKVIVFPELCITGYTCQDLFSRRCCKEARLTHCRKSQKAQRAWMLWYL